MGRLVWYLSFSFPLKPSFLRAPSHLAHYKLQSPGSFVITHQLATHFLFCLIAYTGSISLLHYMWISLNSFINLIRAHKPLLLVIAEPVPFRMCRAVTLRIHRAMYSRLVCYQQPPPPSWHHPVFALLFLFRKDTRRNVSKHCHSREGPCPC